MKKRKGIWLSWLKRHSDKVEIPGSSPGMPIMPLSLNGGAAVLKTASLKHGMQVQILPTASDELAQLVQQRFAKPPSCKGMRVQVPHSSY